MGTGHLLRKAGHGGPGLSAVALLHSDVDLAMASPWEK